MPEGQRLIDQLDRVISMTGDTQPTFDVVISDLRDLLARETNALAQAGDSERLDHGELTLGGTTLKVQVALTANGSERPAVLRPPPGETVHIAIAQGGHGTVGRPGQASTDGADAAVHAVDMGDGLAIAIGGHGADGPTASAAPGSTGGRGRGGGSATVVVGDGCDVYGYGGHGGDGTNGTAGRPPTPGALPMPKNPWLFERLATRAARALYAFAGGQLAPTPMVPSGDGGAGGHGGTVVVTVGDGGFVEALGGDGGAGGHGAIPVGSAPAGGRGTAGNGGDLMGALGSGTVRSPQAFRPGTKGQGANGTDGTDVVR